MKRPSKPLGITMALPVATALLLSSAAPSLASDEDCDTALFGLVIDCSSKGEGKPSKPPKKAPTPTPTRTTQETVAPSPAAPTTASSAPKTTPPESHTPAPTPTVTVVEKTREVVITKEVTVTPVAAPTPEAPLGPTQTQTQTPKTTASASSPAAAAMPSSAPPAGMMTLEQIQAAESNRKFAEQAGQTGPILFFIGLGGIITMLVIAKAKKLFPFEKGNHRP